MRAKDAKLAARLVDAMGEILLVRKRLLAKPNSPGIDDIGIEISAADMAEGIGQGSQAYFYLPKEFGGPLLDLAEKLIRDRLRALGVTLS